MKGFREIISQPNGMMLEIVTLPRPTKMGFSAALDAADFFEIAAIIGAGFKRGRRTASAQHHYDHSLASAVKLT